MSKRGDDTASSYSSCSTTNAELRKMHEEALAFFRAIAERIPLEDSRQGASEGTKRRAS